MNTYFIIAIVMFWMNPLDVPYHDAIEVQTWNDKPLRFDNPGHCWKHISQNFDTLMVFAHTEFPDAIAVKNIICVERADV
tara:strand:+ start:97 stop:336 length:240 start_codon:yes stop_codon:yes gene_type:complete